MAATTPPSLTPTPTPAPQRGDRATFSTRFDAFITWFITFCTEISALATNCYNNALSASVDASTAAAGASATIAASGVIKWISGTTYAQGDVRWSPTDYLSYRRKTVGAGTTDPLSDSTNWALVTAPQPVATAQQYLHVREEQPNTTGGGTSSSGLNTRVLNTVVTNTISGASLSTNQVTLPAGTYRISARSPGEYKHSAHLYNVTDSAVAIVGNPVGTATTTHTNSFIVGRLVIAGTKVFSIRDWFDSTRVMGAAASAGTVEVYSTLEIWKEL